MRFKQLGILLITAILIFAAACSKDKEEEKPDEPDTEENENNNDNGNNNEPEEEEDIDEEDEQTGSEDGEMMNPAIADETDGDVEIIYTNEDPGYAHDFEGLNVTVNKYQIVKVSDIKQSHAVTFKDEIEGYVVTAELTVENTTTDKMYYNAGMQIRTDDRYDYVTSNAHRYVPEDKKLTYDDEEDRAFEPGNKKNFYVTFVMTNDKFAEIQDSDAKFVIERGVSRSKDFSGSFGEEKVFPFIHSEEQAEDVAAAPDFYHDKITTDNVAKKELVFEDTDMNVTEKIDEAKVTINGIQYTKLDINDASKDRFRNFGDDDLMAITIEVEVDNQSDEVISNDGFSTKLVVNDNEVRMLSQGMLENSSGRMIEPGQKGTRQLVYLFAEKYYDIYEEFSLEMGPFFGEESYIFKERTLQFDLPRE